MILQTCLIREFRNCFRKIKRPAITHSAQRPNQPRRARDRPRRGRTCAAQRAGFRPTQQSRSDRAQQCGTRPASGRAAAAQRADRGPGAGTGCTAQQSGMAQQSGSGQPSSAHFAEMTPQFYETTSQSSNPIHQSLAVRVWIQRKLLFPFLTFPPSSQNRARRREPNRRPNRRRQRCDGVGEQHVVGGLPTGEPHQDLRGLRRAAARAKPALGSPPA